MVIGPSAASQEIAVLFGSAGAPVQISDKAVGALWAKLILNCAYNALSAISELPYGSLVQGKGVEAVMRDVAQRTNSLAQPVYPQP